MTFRQAKWRFVSRLKFRSSKMSPLMTSSREWLDGPVEELLEQLRLADVAAQVQVADHEAVVDRVAGRRSSGVGRRRAGSFMAAAPRSSQSSSAGVRDRRSPVEVTSRRSRPCRDSRGRSRSASQGAAGLARRRRRCRSRPSGPAATGRRGAGRSASAARSSASEAEARPVSRLPYASMIRTGRPADQDQVIRRRPRQPGRAPFEEVDVERGARAVEVRRIEGRDQRRGAGRPARPRRRGELVGGLGGGVLDAREPLDEVAAADLAPQLGAGEPGGQVAPGGAQGSSAAVSRVRTP